MRPATKPQCGVKIYLPRVEEAGFGVDRDRPGGPAAQPTGRAPTLVLRGLLLVETRTYRSLRGLLVIAPRLFPTG